MPVFNNALAGAAGSGGGADYKIERSLRFNSSDQSKLTRTPSTEGNTKTWTLSWWMKAPEVDSTIFAAGNGNTPGRFSFGTNGNGAFFAAVVDNNSSVFSITTNAFFRDPSAWYHCCLVCDSTAATQADRFKIIVNGVRQTVTGTLMPQNQNTFVNTTQNHQWSGRSYLNIDFADGYLADIQFVDGQAIDPDGNFGEFDADTGAWNPIKYSGTYNTAASGTTYNGMMSASNGFAIAATSAFDGDTTTEARANLSSDNYLEFTPTTPISFTNGAYVWCYSPNGYGITTYWSVDLDGNGLGSETSFVGSSTANFNGSAWVQVATGSGTLYKVRIRLTRSSGSSAAAIGAIAINGTSASDILVDGTPAGVNGYYLNFSDTSSNTSLGFDANVEGTRYSAFTTGFQSSYPPANMFDGSTTSPATLGSNGGGIMTFTPASAIPYAAASGGVEVYWHQTSQPDRVRINGGSWVNQNNASTGGWQTVSTGDGSITKMEFQDQANSEAVVYAIRVNGTILTDPSGANDWTVNNLTAVVPTPPFSWDGGTLNLSATGGSGNAGGYKDAYFLLPSTGSHSWDMVLNTDSNTGFWFSDQSSASNTHPNQQAGNFVGLRNNGSGTAATGGSGFGSGSPSMPSDAMDGDPRWYFTIDRANGSGTVKAGPSGTSYSFTIPTTGDVYFHVNAYGAYEFDLGSGSPSDIDILIDSPTDYEADSGNNGGNYCTWNSLDKNSNIILSNGNLEVSETSGSQMGVRATQWVTSGKWYWEVELKTSASTVHNGGQISIGVANENQPLDGQGGAGAPTGSVVMWPPGTVYKNGSTVGTNSAYNQPGTVVGVALDMDNRTLSWYINGTLQSVSVTGLESRLTPFVHFYAPDNDVTLVANFGQRPFKYTNAGTNRPAATYLSICTQNLDDPLIADPSTNFDVELWTGDNTTGRVIPTNFSADLIWIKKRSAAEDHVLIDTIRGADNFLRSNSTAIQNTSGGPVTAISDSGFTIDNNGYVNANNATYVGWTWDAGSSNTSVSVGGLNSSIYDQSQTWSTLDTWPSASYSTDPDHAFNGVYGGSNTSDFWYSSGASTVTLSNLATALGTGVTNIKIWVFDRSGDITVTVNNATVNESQNNAYQEISIDHDGSAITTFTIQGTDSSYWGINGIKINDRLLVDSGITVANAPAAASTHRANPTAGFSIVKVDNPNSTESRAHGLGKKPDLIIGKALTGTQQWHIYHSALGKGYYGTFQNNQFSSSDQWGSQEPDSNLFYVKSNTGSGANFAGGMIYYIFAGIQDYSAFGSYTGNGSPNGTFVHTGFRPAFVVMKATSASGAWRTYDSSRRTYNVMDNSLHWNTTEDETIYSNDEIDFLSNGFKMRGNGSFFNGSGTNYIYAAFAETPFKYARAR